jgi:hypothetical protein
VDASTYLTGLRELAAHLRADELARWLPLTTHRTSLTARCAAYVVLSIERSTSLCAIAIDAIEIDDVYSAGTLVRSHIEVVAHVMSVHDRIEPLSANMG